MRFVHTLHKYKKNEHFVHNTIYKQSGINIFIKKKLTFNQEMEDALISLLLDGVGEQCTRGDIASYVQYK